MALNLEKHREAIQAAWRDVLDDNSATNWALFGYEGLSNDLKFICKGDGGLEELLEDLNSGKIMYAFLKVDVPDSSVAKYVLINWQGEGAPTVRKGTCANHIKDVSRLLAGFHLTMHARTEDDLDIKHIRAKIAEAGSSFNFKARSEDVAPSAPVGTAYQKVNPGKEINSEERDKFWMKQEQEERTRQNAERERRQEERRRAEEEAKRREEAARQNPEKQSPPGGLSASDALRRQRSAEAKQLIGGATSHARAMFEQNPHAVNNNRSIIPEKPVRSSIIAQRINSLTQSQNQNQPNLKPHGQEKPKTSPIRNIDKIAMSLERPSQIQHEIIDPSLSPSEPEPSLGSPEPENGLKGGDEPIVKQNILENDMFDASYSSSSNENDDEDSDNKFSTIKRSPYSKNNIAGDLNERELTRQSTVIENVNYKKEHNGNANIDDASPEGAEDDGIYQDLDEDPGLTARALYDYQAADGTEISFDPGDIITHIDQIDEGWWQGLGPTGQFGLFPANYVQLLPAAAH